MAFARIQIGTLNGVDAARELLLARSRNPGITQQDAAQETYDLYTAILSLGGAGVLAEELIADWIGSPYLSLLRWGVTRAIGKSVEDELKKIQKRSNDIFYATLRRHYDEIDDPHVKQVFNIAIQEKTYAKAMGVASQFTNVKYDVYSNLEGYFGKIKLHQDNMESMAQFANDSDDSKLLRTIQAMSALCQGVELLIHGNLPMPLYRGICCGQGSAIYSAITQGASKIPIHVDHCASFTNHYATAIEFAEGAGMTLIGENHHGVVLRLNTPLYAVVATDTVFSGLRGENECIVATDEHLEIKSSDITVLR